MRDFNGACKIWNHSATVTAAPTEQVMRLTIGVVWLLLVATSALPPDLSFGSGVHGGLGINEKAVAQRNRVR